MSHVDVDVKHMVVVLILILGDDHEVGVVGVGDEFDEFLVDRRISQDRALVKHVDSDHLFYIGIFFRRLFFRGLFFFRISGLLSILYELLLLFIVEPFADDLGYYVARNQMETGVSQVDDFMRNDGVAGEFSTAPQIVFRNDSAFVDVENELEILGLKDVLVQVSADEYLLEFVHLPELELVVGKHEVEHNDHISVNAGQSHPQELALLFGHQPVLVILFLHLNHFVVLVVTLNLIFIRIPLLFLVFIGYFPLTNEIAVFVSEDLPPSLLNPISTRGFAIIHIAVLVAGSIIDHLDHHLLED